MMGNLVNVKADLLWLLKRAFHHGLHTLNEATSNHGVATAQLGLMRLLSEHPGLSGADLARRLLVTPQGAQLALSALERRGFVERRADPDDARILRAYLTEQGQRAVTACLAEAIDAYKELFAVLDCEEQDTLRRLLLKFLDDSVDEMDYDRPTI